MIIYLLRQFVKFIGISGIGWLIDIMIYIIFSYILKSNVFVNNVVSSLCGATFVFIISTRFIFANNHKMPFILKCIIYIIYQISLIFLISKLLFLINILILNNVNVEMIKKFAPLASKIIITPITMCLNFIVSKLIIEGNLKKFE